MEKEFKETNKMLPPNRNTRLADKMRLRTLQRGADHWKQQQLIVRLKVVVAQRKKKDPSEVTDQELYKEYQLAKEALAKRSFELEEMHFPSKPKPSRKKKAAAKKKKQRKQKAVEQKVQPKPTLLTFESYSADYLISLHNQKPEYTRDGRVTRFEGATPDLIRTFKEKNGVLKYPDSASDEYLCDQQRRHFSTGIVEIISDKKSKDIYTFPTNTGLGMFVTLSGEQGILYLGIDKTRIYHSYFVPANEADKNSNVFQHAAPPSDPTEGDPDWVQPKYSYELSKEGDLTITTDQHKLIIAPIHTDKLHYTLTTRPLEDLPRS